MARFTIERDPSTGHTHMKRHFDFSHLRSIPPEGTRERLMHALAGLWTDRMSDLFRVYSEGAFLAVILITLCLGGMLYAVHSFLIYKFPWFNNSCIGYFPVAPAIGIYLAFIAVVVMALGRPRVN